MSWPRVASLLFLLCAFAIFVPVSLPRGSSAIADADCLTLADDDHVPPQANGAAALERCSALYPDDVELLADLGAEYERTRASVAAEAVYRRALAIDPDYAELRLRLGRLLLGRGQADEARRQAERALTIQPNRRALLDLLADAKGEPAGAQP